MKAFQRYSFGFIGWALIAYGVYEIMFAAHLMMKQTGVYQGQENFKWLWSSLIQITGRALQIFAIAMICMFLARISKLEDDPEFKTQLNQLVLKIRSAGKKHD